MSNNLWPGIIPYHEDDGFEFCGRNSDVASMFSIIDNNLLLTLYGKTGVGKTSVLQAGLFPLLRKNNYLPIIFRTGTGANQDTASALINEIKTEAESRGLIIRSDCPEFLSEDASSEDFLWKYFFATTILNTKNEWVFPVIVLDQFEDIFRNRPESILFLKQLNNLLDDFHVSPFSEEHCSSKFRIIISIREDDLCLLEDMIDSLHLKYFKDNRYRLTFLSKEGARDVVQIGKDCVGINDLEYITEKIFEIAGNQDGTISSNMLSLCCNQLFQKGKGKITRKAVDDFSSKPFNDYYNNALSGTKLRTRLFIQHKLVEGNRRGFVTREDFNKNVDHSDAVKLLEGENKILQTFHVGGKDYVELVHDSIAKTVTQNTRFNPLEWLVAFGVSVIMIPSLCEFFSWTYVQYLVNDSSKPSIPLIIGFVSLASVSIVPLCFYMALHKKMTKILTIVMSFILVSVSATFIWKIVDSSVIDSNIVQTNSFVTDYFSKDINNNPVLLIIFLLLFCAVPILCRFLSENSFNSYNRRNNVWDASSRFVLATALISVFVLILRFRIPFASYASGAFFLTLAMDLIFLESNKCCLINSSLLVIFLLLCFPFSLITKVFLAISVILMLVPFATDRIIVIQSINWYKIALSSILCLAIIFVSYPALSVMLLPHYYQFLLPDITVYCADSTYHFEKYVSPFRTEPLDSVKYADFKYENSCVLIDAEPSYDAVNYPWKELSSDEYGFPFTKRDERLYYMIIPQMLNNKMEYKRTCNINTKKILDLDEAYMTDVYECKRGHSDRFHRTEAVLESLSLNMNDSLDFYVAQSLKEGLKYEDVLSIFRCSTLYMLSSLASQASFNNDYRLMALCIDLIQITFLDANYYEDQNKGYSYNINVNCNLYIAGEKSYSFRNKDNKGLQYYIDVLDFVLSCAVAQQIQYDLKWIEQMIEMQKKLHGQSLFSNAYEEIYDNYASSFSFLMRGAEREVLDGRIKSLAGYYYNIAQNDIAYSGLFLERISKFFTYVNNEDDLDQIAEICKQKIDDNCKYAKESLELKRELGNQIVQGRNLKHQLDSLYQLVLARQN